MKRFGQIIIGLIALAIFVGGMLSFMAFTGLGFVAVQSGEVYVKKSFTKYDPQELYPGYHFYIPGLESVEKVQARAKLINYSVSEGDKKDSTLLIYEPALKGKDAKGVPIHLALSIEVLPIADQMAEMFEKEGEFDVAFEKNVKQPNRDAVQKVLSQFYVDTIQDKRTELATTLEDLIRSKYAKNPYFKLININLKDILPPEGIVKQQLKVAAATQDALIAKEGIKKAQNEALAREARSKGIAEAKIIEAQGEADAVEIKAKANARKVTLEAEAQANKNKLINETTTEKTLRSDTVQAWREGGAQVPKSLIESQGSKSKGSQFIFKL